MKKQGKPIVAWTPLGDQVFLVAQESMPDGSVRGECCTQAGLWFCGISSRPIPGLLEGRAGKVPVSSFTRFPG